jgi:poly-gamma-glutamate synthesis protein (capsule biosynthesis protein)
LNDYEGIQGYEDYRGDLALMYFADIEPASSNVVTVAIVPLQICNFRLVSPSSPDIDWLRQTLDRECREFGTRVTMMSPGRLALSWPGSPTT